MRSYTSARLGTSTYTYPPGGINEVTVVTKGYRNFDVNPNPCINRGDKKRPNAYTFSKNHIDCPYGYIRRIYDSKTYGTQSTDGYLTNNVGATPSLQVLGPNVREIDVRNKALAKLYKAIKDSDINISVTVGEGRETLDMLRAVGVSARRVLTELRKAIRRAKRNPEFALRILLQKIGKPIAGGVSNPIPTVGGLQLAWSLAIRPLIKDVENYRNHMASNKDVGVELHFDSRAQSVYEKSVDNVSMGSGFLRSESFSESMRIEFGVNLKINDMPTFEDWRIGTTVRPSLAWELMTLSFLVDYFVNVGQYIELQEAALLNNGLTFIHGYQTITYMQQVEIVSDYRYRGYDYTDVSNWKTTRLTKTKNRGVLTAFPVPYGVTVKLPSAATPLLNIAALLSQLLVKR